MNEWGSLIVNHDKDLLGKDSRAKKISDQHISSVYANIREKHREANNKQQDITDEASYLVGLQDKMLAGDATEYNKVFGAASFSRMSADQKKAFLSGTLTLDGNTFGESSMLAAAVVAQGNEEKRIVAEIGTVVKKRTGSDVGKLVEEFQGAMMGNNAFKVRATQNLLADSGFHVKMLANGIKEIEGSEKGFDPSKITDDTWNALANNLSHGDVANNIRKKDIFLFNWALQRSAKDPSTGKFIANDLGLPSDFANTDVGKSAWKNFITDSGAIFSQTSDAIKHAFKNQLLSQADILNAFSDAMTDPTIIDHEKLAILGSLAGITPNYDPFASPQDEAGKRAKDAEELRAKQIMKMHLAQKTVPGVNNTDERRQYTLQNQRNPGIALDREQMPTASQDPDSLEPVINRSLIGQEQAQEKWQEWQQTGQNTSGLDLLDLGIAAGVPDLSPNGGDRGPIDDANATALENIIRDRENH